MLDKHIILRFNSPDVIESLDSIGFTPKSSIIDLATGEWVALDKDCLHYFTMSSEDLDYWDVLEDVGIDCGYDHEMFYSIAESMIGREVWYSNGTEVMMINDIKPKEREGYRLADPVEVINYFRRKRKVELKEKYLEILQENNIARENDSLEDMLYWVGVMDAYEQIFPKEVLK